MPPLTNKKVLIALVLVNNNNSGFCLTPAVKIKYKLSWFEDKNRKYKKHNW